MGEATELACRADLLGFARMNSREAARQAKLRKEKEKKEAKAFAAMEEDCERIRAEKEAERCKIRRPSKKLTAEEIQAAYTMAFGALPSACPADAWVPGGYLVGDRTVRGLSIDGPHDTFPLLSHKDPWNLHDERNQQEFARKF